MRIWNRNTIEHQHLNDDELGTIRVHQSVRAKRLTFRVDEEGLRVTIPRGCSSGALKTVIEEMRPRLRALLKKQRITYISPDYKIKATHFRLEIRVGAADSLRIVQKEGCFYCCCPETFLWQDEVVQQRLKACIIVCLRKAAKAYLPGRLNLLAQEHGLSFSSVRISSSQGRWGSCSARRNINLSLYLMLLPSHLIDYVLLHELAHLREMNHSASFWMLLNDFTLGRATALRGELKGYSPCL